MMLAHGDWWGLKGLGAVLITVVVSTGCADDKQMTASDNGTSTGGTSDTPTTTGSTGPGSTSDGTTTDTTMSPTTTGTPMTSSTTDEPKMDMGGMSMCSPSQQDCPDGLKCTSWESDPAAPPGWDATRCVPIPMSAGSVGDECAIDQGESVFSGLDNCGEGSICLNFDFMTGTGGTCTEYCTPEGECPLTAGGKAICVEGANAGVLPICLATCDPLVQDCGMGQGCYGDPSLDGFICFTPDPGENTGTDNSPCEFTNACQAGFSCAAASVVEGCDPMAVGCCTPFCSVSGGDKDCAATEDCVPFYAMDPPPGLEDVGICAIPQ